jgi:hypothetical protein
MLFTDGKLLKFERMMQERPHIYREPANKTLDRDCPHCLYFDNHLHKCSKGKCVVFND